MKKYNLFVRLGGDIMNEVPVSGACASEVAVLRRIHGEDAVVRVAEIGRFAEPERDRRYDLIMDKYGKDKDSVELVTKLIGEPENPRYVKDDRIKVLVQKNMAAEVAPFEEESGQVDSAELEATLKELDDLGVTYKDDVSLDDAKDLLAIAKEELAKAEKAPKKGK